MDLAQSKMQLLLSRKRTPQTHMSSLSLGAGFYKSKHSSLIVGNGMEISQDISNVNTQTEDLPG